MSGSVFAVLSAFFFAFNAMFTRKAVVKVPDATIGILITVPLGALFSLLILITGGHLSGVVGFPWQNYVWLSAAGVVHYLVGRSFNYNCVQMVGANIGSILVRLRIFVTVTLGVSMLGESLTWQLIVGVLLLIFGVTFAGLDFKAFRDGQGLFSHIPRKAFLFAFGASISWGISPILIKLGIDGSDTPTAGVFISFLAASIVLSLSLLNHGRRRALSGMSGKAVGLFCIAGLISCFANLMRFAALSMAPVSVVTPLVSISPVFLLLISFMFNRKLEIFSIPVIIGSILVVIASFLLV